MDCPQSNGLNERLNQTIINKVRCKMNSGKKGAKLRILEQCVDEYNSIIHSVTKCSPTYFLSDVEKILIYKETVLNSTNNYE